MNETIETEIEYLEKSLKEMLETSKEIEESNTLKSKTFKMIKNRVFQWPWFASHASIIIFLISNNTKDAIFVFSILFVAGMADYCVGISMWKAMKEQENQLFLLNERIRKTKENINQLRKNKKTKVTQRNTLEKQKHLLRLWYQLGLYENKQIPVEEIKCQYQSVLTNEEIEHSIEMTLTRK